MQGDDSQQRQLVLPDAPVFPPAIVARAPSARSSWTANFDATANPVFAFGCFNGLFKRLPWARSSRSAIPEHMAASPTNPDMSGPGLEGLRRRVKTACTIPSRQSQLVCVENSSRLCVGPFMIARR
jgi:hypothetical protein